MVPPFSPKDAVPCGPSSSQVGASRCHVGLGAEGASIVCLCLTVQFWFSELRSIVETLAARIALIEFSPGPPVESSPTRNHSSR